ncbi:hypothetical protein AGOR_G00142000 [Albula goreensis]|uniref:Uncharacterized protein n=1 Tax=Albula goreensis TaxID=1534307 RepID=A0A8T3D4T6_9TELE|nr:hypothetical protein AGOR_G00142000 [Albula goreensis]
MRAEQLWMTLLSVAWLWPAALSSSGSTHGRRRHKDVYLGEHVKNKHGGHSSGIILNTHYNPTQHGNP